MSIVLYENKKDCCGCWGCYNICPKSAIEMIEDNEGFKYPHIRNELCVECGLCQKVCPVKTSKCRIEDNKSKKCIGIINLQFTDNYGAVIAASVLESVVQKNVGSNIEVKTIDYRPTFDFANSFDLMKDIIKDSGGLRLYIKSNYSKGVFVSNECKMTRRNKFLVFRDKFLNLTETIRYAKNINKAYNFIGLIVGSDVVWAPKRIDNYRADGYCLKFSNNNQKRISYAPSLDSSVNTKLKKLKKYYREGLKNFDFVSVREKSNVDFIQSLTDKKVYECCDPAFLVDSNYYNEMINEADIKCDNQKFIYVYILEVNENIVNYANRLSKEKNLKICYCSKFHNDYQGNNENCVSDGPAEFLYRIKMRNMY